MSDDSPTFHSVTNGGVTGDHIPLPAPQALVAPTLVKGEHNTIKSSLVPFACWRANDMRFEFESSFVLPEMADEIGALKDLIDRHTLPDAKGQPKHKPSLSVFGHADPTGNDDFNKALSGRRAQAIYGLLIRKVELWEDLHARALGNDNWEPVAIQRMQRTLKQPASGPLSKGARQALFKAYMDHVCTLRGKGTVAVGAEPTQPIVLELKPEDFLANGEDPGGKGDFQGCGEFNPILIFSEKENRTFTDPNRKEERDRVNAPDRRVVIYLFRPGVRISPDSWPCPRAKEGVVGCRKRFWSDGEKRRSMRLPEEQREFERTKDTFACRFYDRLSNTSPCESIIRMARGNFEAVPVAPVPGETDDHPPSNSEVFDSTLSPRILGPDEQF